MYNSENPSVKIKQRNKANTVYKYKTSKYNKSKYISDHSKHKWNKLDKQQKYFVYNFRRPRNIRTKSLEKICQAY